MVSWALSFLVIMTDFSFPGHPVVRRKSFASRTIDLEGQLLTVQWTLMLRCREATSGRSASEGFLPLYDEMLHLSGLRVIRQLESRRVVDLSLADYSRVRQISSSRPKKRIGISNHGTAALLELARIAFKLLGPSFLEAVLSRLCLPQSDRGRPSAGCPPSVVPLAAIRLVWKI